jgi:hypothetical protein
MAETIRRRPLKKLVKKVQTARANSLERRSERLKKRAPRVRRRAAN